jgi:NAD-dependent SIR2 family protein deacetylase
LVSNYLQFFSDFTTSLSSEEPKAVSVVEETSNTEKTPPEEINKEFRSAEEVPLRTSKHLRTSTQNIDRLRKLTPAPKTNLTELKTCKDKVIRIHK